MVTRHRNVSLGTFDTWSKIKPDSEDSLTRGAPEEVNIDPRVPRRDSTKPVAKTTRWIGEGSSNWLPNCTLNLERCRLVGDIVSLFLRILFMTASSLFVRYLLVRR